MFLVELTYKKSLAEVDRFLPEHGQFLDRQYAARLLIFSGRKNPREGGLFLVNSEERQVVERLLLEDPFHREGIADYRVVEFTPTKWDERFRAFLT